MIKRNFISKWKFFFGVLILIYLMTHSLFAQFPYTQFLVYRVKQLLIVRSNGIVVLTWLALRVFPNLLKYQRWLSFEPHKVSYKYIQKEKLIFFLNTLIYLKWLKLLINQSFVLKEKFIFQKTNPQNFKCLIT